MVMPVEAVGAPSNNLEARPLIKANQEAAVVRENVAPAFPRWSEPTIHYQALILQVRKNLFSNSAFASQSRLSQGARSRNIIAST